MSYLPLFDKVWLIYVAFSFNILFDYLGTYYYNNGNKYEGDWKNGVKEGKGNLKRKL